MDPADFRTDSRQPELEPPWAYSMPLVVIQERSESGRGDVNRQPTARTTAQCLFGLHGVYCRHPEIFRRSPRLDRFCSWDASNPSSCRAGQRYCSERRRAAARKRSRWRAQHRDRATEAGQKRNGPTPALPGTRQEPETARARDRWGGSEGSHRSAVLAEIPIMGG